MMSSAPAFNRRERRWQAVAQASAGAPASFDLPRSQGLRSAPPRTRRLFFCAFNPIPDPMISISCAGAGVGSCEMTDCYRVTGPVTFAVTGKLFLSNGLEGLLPVTDERATLYTCASVRVRAPISLSFLGNMVTNEYNLISSMGWLLLSLLPQGSISGNTVTLGARRAGVASAANKIGGGYRRSGRDLVDLRSLAGDARRNFWSFGSRCSWAASSRSTDPRNGGNPPILGGGSGAVGTVALEWCGQATAIIGLSGVRRLLRQQAHRLGLVVQGAAGGDRPGRVAPPPIARAVSLGPWHRMLAGFGSAFAPRSHDCGPQVGQSLSSFGWTGWG